MTSPHQKIFKKIVLHNKLLPEDRIDALLKAAPDPEDAVQVLINKEVLSAKLAEKLLATYTRKVEKYQLRSRDDHASSTLNLASISDLEHAKVAAPAAEDQPSVDWAAEPTEQEPTEPKEGPDGRELPAAKPEITDGSRELILDLLKRAREMGASDLHIKPEMAPVVRLAGTLRTLEMRSISAQACEQSLLALLEEDQREAFLASNDIDFCYDAGELGRFRTNYMREHRGVDAVFRPIASRTPSFDELGLPETVKGFTNNRVGIVLVTGPKGCGKTTTLAAMVDLINSSRREHIITVEDPIEFVQPCKKGHVNQREVGAHTRSFSNALRSALREAPDVILVGEMRDLETTSLAITAAETGHLVLATLHTPDTIRTIGRVLDVFPPKEQGQIRAMISESLRGICSQLLIPGADGQSMELAYEVLVNTQAIGHLIREKRVHQIRGLMQAGKRQGMVLMDDTLARLVRERRISREVAEVHAEDMKYLEQQLQAGSATSS